MLKVQTPTKMGFPTPPAPALLIAAIWVALWLINDYVYDMPKWLDLVFIGASFVIFLYWLITGSRK